MLMEKVPSKDDDFILQLDNVPGIWQFLKGLQVDDLVTELVQNDLDAGATYTTIEFGKDLFVCQGNGIPVDDDGWRRLTYFTGAGDKVPEKKNSFGVKNHGLKACFTIGDEILVRSGGKKILQTLYKNGLAGKPSPATNKNPKEDKSAPLSGCRIEVPYRKKQLVTDVGEKLAFPVITDQDKKRIFLEACKVIPNRFIAVIRPGVRPQYKLTLSHYSLGRVTFEFKLGRTRKFAYSTKLYNRACRVVADSNFQISIEELQEQFYLFPLQLKATFARDTPLFFKHPKGFLVEISWPLSRNGKPRLLRGRRRYPIEYPGDAQNVLTGNGFSISAPYVSDRERHGIADDKFNDYVDSSCIEKMVMILRRELMPKHGAKSLNLLVWSEYIDKSIVSRSVESLIEQRGIPLGKPSNKHVKKSGKKDATRTRTPRLNFGPRKVKGQNLKRIILPVYTGESGKFNNLLSALCPNNEDQIHEQVPGQFFSILENNEFDNDVEIKTFDESDVLDRFINLSAVYYSWQDEEERVRQLCNPAIVDLYLTCIDKYHHDDIKNDQAKIEQIKTNGILPDTFRKPVKLSELYAGKQIPDQLPVQNTPPIVHQDISNHTIFKKKLWKLKIYKFEDFLDHLNKELPSDVLARSFWKWLEKNQKKVPLRSWWILTKLQIWPDDDGELHSLDSLCKPTRSYVSQILKGHILEPHFSIYRIKLIKNAKKGKLSIRTVPHFEEVKSFVSFHFNQYLPSHELSDQERITFHKFESDIATLSKYSKICEGHLNQIPSVVALNKKGCVKPVKDLVLITPEITRLCLLNVYVLNRKSHRLNKMNRWRANDNPTAEQIFKTLQEDPRNKEALLSRLQSFIQTSYRDKENEKEYNIGEIACIPSGRDFCKPNQLAFAPKIGKGDYWGDWKKRLSSKGLTAEIQQKIYLKIGVISSEPSRETSRQFFIWLHKQSSKIIEVHLPQIVRHIWYSQGKTIQWCKDFPDIPFIPFELNNEYGLATYREAMSSKYRLYIRDFPAMEDGIKNRNLANIRLAITSSSRVKEPIDAILKQLGLRSLKEKAGFPQRVNSKNAHQVSSHVLQYLKKLRSSKLKNQLLKKLTNFDIDVGPNSLNSRWKANLSAITQVKVAEDLEGVFKLYNCNYNASIDSAFVKSSGIIWLENGPGMIDSFFSVVADLIFNSPKKYIVASLQKVIDSEIREEPWTDLNEFSDCEWDEGREDIDYSFFEDEEGDDLPEKKMTHRDLNNNPDDNIPDPKVLSGKDDSSTVGRTSTKGKNGEAGGGKDEDRSTFRVESKNEKWHKETLKKDHYAYHCQICLAENEPDELAPDSSYVANSNQRKRIIEASHMDPVHGQGARHAGNMLILCAYHHHLYGDIVSRQDVIDSLNDPAAVDKNVTFSVKKSGTKDNKSIKGKVTTIKLPLSGEEVHCFFTQIHADYWLEKSEE